MIICSNCNTEVTNDRWTICPECGSELKQQDIQSADAEKSEISIEEFENAEIEDVLSENKKNNYKKSLKITRALVAFAFFASIIGSMITTVTRSKKRGQKQNTHYQKNYSSKTLTELDKIIEKNKFNADALYARANELLKAARFKEAIKDYKQSLKLNPHYINNFYGIGQAKRRLKDLSGSLAAFDTLVKLRPKYWQAWAERGVTCKLMKNEEEVKRCVAKVEEITKKKNFKAVIEKRAEYERRYIEKLNGIK